MAGDEWYEDSGGWWVWACFRNSNMPYSAPDGVSEVIEKGVRVKPSSPLFLVLWTEIVKASVGGDLQQIQMDVMGRPRRPVSPRASSSAAEVKAARWKSSQ